MCLQAANREVIRLSQELMERAEEHRKKADEAASREEAEKAAEHLREAMRLENAASNMVPI